MYLPLISPLLPYTSSSPPPPSILPLPIYRTSTNICGIIWHELTKTQRSLFQCFSICMLVVRWWPRATQIPFLPHCRFPPPPPHLPNARQCPTKTSERKFQFTGESSIPTFMGEVWRAGGGGGGKNSLSVEFLFKNAAILIHINNYQFIVTNDKNNNNSNKSYKLIYNITFF